MQIFPLDSGQRLGFYDPSTLFGSKDFSNTSSLGRMVLERNPGARFAELEQAQTLHAQAESLRTVLPINPGTTVIIKFLGSSQSPTPEFATSPELTLSSNGDPVISWQEKWWVSKGTLIALILP